ncbi:hypothetical protein [uncultured Bacteroides sp.]|uniref:hypothetical protein n=1 Tax=uncultured Bacteroides sp. TaxID=162156 RepID=UPI00280B810D|nr:hypothetical protein [uncultured Bacteroides sp.]
MKHFIEVTSSTKKYLLNVNTISYIYQGKEKTTIVLLPQGENQSRSLLVLQTYEEIKGLIQAAL